MAKIVGSVYLAMFVIFLILGNLTRFNLFTASMGSGNLSELVLYVFAFFCSLIVYMRLCNCKLFLILTGGVIFSLFVGLGKWDVDSTAIVYNLRLVLQITSAAVAGIYLYDRYADNVSQFVRAYLLLYCVIIVFSYIIFIAFPETALFSNYRIIHKREILIQQLW